jgi:hypothetical protein
MKYIYRYVLSSRVAIVLYLSFCIILLCINISSASGSKRLRMTIQPEVDPAHAAQVATFLRDLRDVEISQAIAAPRALVDRLPGVAIQHLRTASETAVVELARTEECQFASKRARIYTEERVGGSTARTFNERSLAAQHLSSG